MEQRVQLKDYDEQLKTMKKIERYPEEDKDMFPPTKTEEFSAMMNPVSLPKAKFEEMFNKGLKTG